MLARRTLTTCLTCALLASALVACDDDGGTASPRVDAGSITLTESPSSALVWVLEFDMTGEATPTVDVEAVDGHAAWTVATEPGASHRVVLTGLRADASYDVTVAGPGGEAPETRRVDTGSLPADFPPLEVTTADVDAVGDGFVVFPVFRWNAGDNGPDDTYGYLAAVDEAGEVVWYVGLDHETEYVTKLANGNLAYTSLHQSIYEIDREGKRLREWVVADHADDAPADAIPLDIDAVHHELTELPNGNRVVLSVEKRTVTTETCPNYEPDTGDSFEVVGDVVVEFDPDTGEVVQEISMFDSLDPCRRTDRGFHSGFWNSHYGGEVTKDWTHANAAFFDEEAGLMIVSLRHQDWLVAYRYTPGEPDASGEVAWILGAEGEPGDYGDHPALTPVGTPFDWPYHQHAPMVTPQGTLILYDNGNLRPGTNTDPDDAAGDADQTWSRVVEYALDTTAADPADWTVEQVWEWLITDADGGLLYAPFVGDADALAGGNVLVTSGGLVSPASNAVGDPTVKKWTRISEVAPSGEAVLQIELRDKAEADFTGFTAYRAHKIQGFLR